MFEHCVASRKLISAFRPAGSLCLSSCLLAHPNMSPTSVPFRSNINPACRRGGWGGRNQSGELKETVFMQTSVDNECWVMPRSPPPHCHTSCLASLLHFTVPAPLLPSRVCIRSAQTCNSEIIKYLHANTVAHSHTPVLVYSFASSR